MPTGLWHGDWLAAAPQGCKFQADFRQFRFQLFRIERRHRVAPLNRRPRLVLRLRHARRSLTRTYVCASSIGLMIGIDLGDGARTLRVVRRLLERGWITLPAGAGAEVLSLSPPLTIDPVLLDAFTETLAEVL